MHAVPSTTEHPADEGEEGAEAGGVLRVVVVDDHRMMAEALASVLGDEPDLLVVGVENSVASGVAVATDERPDVVVMDYRLQDGDGVDATRQLRDALPDVNVVMLTAYPDDNILGAALEAGCCGFVAKGSPVEELLNAVRAAATGGGVFAPDVIARLVRLQNPRAGAQDLSPREQQVLELVATGQSTGGIASALDLSQHTVRNHIRNVLTKLGAHSKLEAVVIAARDNLIRAPGQTGPASTA